jgi:hypothetical protein
LTIDKRSNMSWTISHSIGDLGGQTMNMQVTAGGIGGVTDVTKLSLTKGTSIAGGTLVTGSGPNGAPILQRTGLNLTDIANTFYVGSTSGNALPVQMTKFTAMSKRMGAELQWSTATEKNCYGFEVERRMWTAPLA